MTQISRWDYTIGHNHDKFQEWYAEVIYSRPVGKNHDNLDNWKRLVAKYGKDWEYYDRDLFFGYKWNSMGHRNDYEFNSWGNKPWMLALGDSNVEGTGNRRIDLFHEVIAKEKGLVNYNAGIGGTSNHAAMWNGLTLLNLAETKPKNINKIDNTTDKIIEARTQNEIKKAYDKKKANIQKGNDLNDLSESKKLRISSIPVNVENKKINIPNFKFVYFEEGSGADCCFYYGYLKEITPEEKNSFIDKVRNIENFEKWGVSVEN